MSDPADKALEDLLTSEYLASIGMPKVKIIPIPDGTYGGATFTNCWIEVTDDGESDDAG